MEPTDFSKYLKKFLTDYISSQRNYSKNTKSAYRDTFTLLINYCNIVCGIKPDKLDFQHLESDTIEKFLDWLEHYRSNSISTRNMRLAVLHSFFRYLQNLLPERLYDFQKILQIKEKKATQKTVDYYSEVAIKDLLEKPDRESLYGRRDCTLLLLLYETAARVQEIVNLDARDVRMQRPSFVCIKGKGDKINHVPITKTAQTILQKHMEEWNLSPKYTPDKPLFVNHKGNRLSRQGVTYILKKYSDSKKASPHMVRHSRAMHLLNAGINLVYIRDLLGHSSIKTTERYARANIERKFNALSKLDPHIDENTLKDWNSDDDLSNWLKKL